MRPARPSPTRRRLHPDKPLLFIASLLPLAWLLWLGSQERLGANPVETLSHATGDWSLRFLLLTLAITPLRRLSGWNGVQKYRRMLGLFAFFYVGLHFTVYLVSKAIKAAKVLAFEDLGMEAIYEFEVKDMPVTVAVDAKGSSVHKTGPREWQARIGKIPVTAA